MIRGRILHGDAFDLIRELDDGTIDLILTSPPYWGLRTYGLNGRGDVLEQWRTSGCDEARVPPYDWYRDAGGILGLEPFPDWYVSHLVEFFTRARRSLKEGGSIWVNLGDTYFARWSSIRETGRQGYNAPRERRRTPAGGYRQDKQLLMIPARFAIAMQAAGWILRNDLIWAKPNVIPHPGTDRLRLSHEHWFHFVLRQANRRPTYFYDISETEAESLDVVTMPTSAGSDAHSATFPVGIIAPRIRSSSPVGGVVLDPFAGTGRAAVEAIRSGRSAVGFELSPVYATCAARAVEDAITSALETQSNHGGDPTTIAPNAI